MTTRRKWEPQVIVCDLLGPVVYDGRKEAVTYLTETFSKQPHYIRDIVFGGLYRQLRTDGISWQAYQQSLGAAGIRLGRKVVDTWFGFYRPRQPILELLREVRKGGLQVAILSNMFPELLRHLDKQYQICACFDHIVTSHQVKQLKPGQRIYEELERAVGVVATESESAPKGILYFDNATRNIETAKRRGWRAVLMSNTSNDDDLEQKIRHELERESVLKKPQKRPH